LTLLLLLLLPLASISCQLPGHQPHNWHCCYSCCRFSIHLSNWQQLMLPRKPLQPPETSDDHASAAPGGTALLLLQHTHEPSTSCCCLLSVPCSCVLLHTLLV
jgi:hypothetical protein